MRSRIQPLDLTYNRRNKSDRLNRSVVSSDDASKDINCIFHLTEPLELADLIKHHASAIT